MRDLLTKGQIGPLDGFRSKAGKPFSAVLRYNKEEKKAEFVFDGQRDANGAIKIDFTGLQPVAEAPAARFGRRRPGLRDAAELCRPSGRERRGQGPRAGARGGSSRATSPCDQFMKMLQTGKTDLLEKFWSQRTRRPFSAFLVLKEDGSTGFEFAPRPPKDPNAPAKGRKAKKAVEAGGSEIGPRRGNLRS